MADKTTKKAAPQKEATLQSMLSEKRADLLEARKSHAAGELVNPRVITSLKKDIARLLTKHNAQKEAK
jgi:ribosomal protein L29